VDASTQLWTDRYAPQSLKEICGNKSQVEKLRAWLRDWFVLYTGSQCVIANVCNSRPTNLKEGFKAKSNKNDTSMYRAVLISGSPGIGKTTSAHLCAKLEGFTPIELNASDARSKKLVEVGYLLLALAISPCLMGFLEQYQHLQYFVGWMDGRRRGV
jgi:replication factor C subunit 1